MTQAENAPRQLTPEDLSPSALSDYFHQVLIAGKLEFPPLVRTQVEEFYFLGAVQVLRLLDLARDIAMPLANDEAVFAMLYERIEREAIDHQNERLLEIMQNILRRIS